MVERSGAPWQMKWWQNRRKNRTQSDLSSGVANRLATQSSPYLLQHAQNPVDWYPWGEEAFAEAVRRDVPVLVSIGYSTCYWCHVMERESFENAEVAKHLNEAFVCIKVDREERPDIDDVYMAATVAMLGHGGWPMNVCLDPATRKPFWCGTYFPPTAGRGMPGLLQVVSGISDAWKERRAEVLEQANQLAAAVSEQLSAAIEPTALDAEPISEAVSMLLRMGDQQHGGFGKAPKFPQPVFLDFLIDVRGSLDSESQKAVDAAVKLTLDKMMLGGIRDHVGGGFHRYAVDSIWLVPHFEKMLYDQAQLAIVYVKAAAIYDDTEYASVAREIADYVLREMTDSRGLFFSAQDAEVDHREGLNYLWTPAEMMAVLGDEDGIFAVKFYGLDLGANFKDPHHPSEPARNVLFRKERFASSGADARIRAINQKLLAARMLRKQPHLDDKVVASWNGLMISALAHVGAVLGDQNYVAAAKAAADALLQLHRDSSGGLLRVSRGGKASTSAFLEDHACLAQGLLELHHTLGGQSPYLAAADALLAAAENQFARDGKLFDTRDESGELFIRTSSIHDGAMPSGTSVMLHALRQRAALSKSPEHLARLLSYFPAVSGAVRQSPVSVINTTRCLYRVLVGGFEGATETLANIGPVKTTAAPVGAYPVEVYSSADRVELRTDRPAAFRIIMRISPGYHILAAQPGPGGAHMFPLRISLIGGTGVQAYADYPEGKPYGPDGELLVNNGDIEFDIVLEREGNWSGRPILTATFQACSDTECLAPMTVELDVAIDRAT